MALLDKLRSALVIIGGIYVGAVGLLTVPWVQTHVVYLNAVRLPWFADFTQPEKYGLAPNKTANLKLTVSNAFENISLGAWFILSDSYYHSLPTLPDSSPTAEHIQQALVANPTILFLHGNAATRAFHVRVRQYSMFSSRLGTNVFALDYRGFADSEGTPSEDGLARDARVAWDWLVEHGARPQDIIIAGHSLGTGVGAKLLRDLENDGINPRGCVLMSPFSRIEDVVQTYHILGVLPLMRPLQVIPYATSLISNALIHRFDTLSIIPNTTTPLIIAHARNDFDIPYTHSEILFNTILNNYLPPLPSVPPLASLGQGSGGMGEEWGNFSRAMAERSQVKEDVVKKTEIKGLGTLEEFFAPYLAPPPPPSASAAGSVPPTPVGSVVPNTPWTPHRVWSDLGSMVGGLNENETDSVAGEGSQAADILNTGRMVRLVLTERGSHDYIGLEEGVQDIIGRCFDLF